MSDLALAPLRFERGQVRQLKHAVCDFEYKLTMHLQASFFKAIIRAAQLNTSYVPIISEEGYRFPTGEMFTDLRRTYAEILF